MKANLPLNIDYQERLQNSIRGLRVRAQQVERNNAPEAIRLFEQAYQIGKQNKMDISQYAPVIQRLAVLYRRLGRHGEEIDLLEQEIKSNPQYVGAEKWRKRLNKKIALGNTRNKFDYKRRTK